MGSVALAKLKVDEGKQDSSSQQLHPSDAGSSTGVEGEGHRSSLSATPSQGEQSHGQGGAREEEETDSEDDGSTEGDGEEGKVLSSERPPETGASEEGCVDKTTPPLTEYIINVVHFLDAILSNNSTDDHMREFILQGGMHPLLKLLSLPVLPLDFPSSAACAAITGACRSIMVSHKIHNNKVGEDF